MELVLVRIIGSTKVDLGLIVVTCKRKTCREIPMYYELLALIPNLAVKTNCKFQGIFSICMDMISDFKRKSYGRHIGHIERENQTHSWKFFGQILLAICSVSALQFKPLSNPEGNGNEHQYAYNDHALLDSSKV
ncbi:unnamed protein product [Vicia faba]|uniref:Uncharacterized protein n=1 Tax=Vicia faba TaxID=3906 RepID=A0AAV0ZWQ3_VICFA|nr:unnamed protein product [Vicia faba]